MAELLSIKPNLGKGEKIKPEKNSQNEDNEPII